MSHRHNAWPRSDRIPDDFMLWVTAALTAETVPEKASEEPQEYEECGHADDNDDRETKIHFGYTRI